MAKYASQNKRQSLSDRAWGQVVTDWELKKSPKEAPHSLTESDLERLPGFKKLDNLVRVGVSKLKSAREALFSFRAVLGAERGGDRAGGYREKGMPKSARPGPLLQKIMRIFDGVAFNVSNVRKCYNDVIPDQIKAVVDTFGGKSFTRDPKTKTPNVLMLASVPKEKENKDLSIKTLMSGVDEFVKKLEKAKAKYPEKLKHEFKVMRNEHHLVLYRVVDGVEQSIEMSFRRANKVDIFINGSDKPNGSLYNDDALRTAEAFLKGKNMNFRKRPEQPRYTEYVVVKDVAKLRGE